jgi:hypothetical protein
VIAQPQVEEGTDVGAFGGDGPAWGIVPTHDAAVVITPAAASWGSSGSWSV